MKVAITIIIADEYADADDDSGVTEEGYDLLLDALLDTGIADDIQVNRA